MNNELQTVQFDDISVSIIDHNGEGWFTGEDIGLALEYADDPKNSVRKIFERNQDELADYSTTVKLTAVDGKEREHRVYNEEGVMIIGFLSKQPKAVAFRKWAVKILKAYRHKELVHQDAIYLEQLQSTVEMQKDFIAGYQQQINFLQDQLKQSQNLAQGMQSIYQQEEDKVQRLLRARGTVKQLERRDIFAKLDDGMNVGEIAKWMYRSPAFVKAVIAAGRWAK